MGTISSVSVRIWPQEVGVFKDLGEQQFTAFGMVGSAELDITTQVDWYVEAFSFANQPGGPQDVVTINSQGLATIVQSATWGRVNISACYPRGCSTQPSRSSASTSMTVVTVSPWVEPICKSPPAVVNYQVTEYMSNVRISTNALRWDIDPGNTFSGGYARLWAFYSEDGQRTFIGIGWDYTTNNSGIKYVSGYGGDARHVWVGQMISTICDQTRCPVDPQACNGRKRSNIFFIPN